MAAVFRGRFTAEIDGPFVVFIIGMRINRWWALHKWLPVAFAMPRMLKQLEEERERGLLHAAPFLYWPGAAVVQYWRSFEQLEAFAKDADDPHLEVWRDFWRRVGKSGRTGIWHETFLVRAGEYEAIYGNMPDYGLGKASEVVTVAAGRSARDRLRAAATT